jgi:Circadian oscillating protein COP23
MLKPVTLLISVGVILANHSIANANPLVWQILSQNNGTIPDVIIDDKPSPDNPTPTPTPNNQDPRFTCEMYNGAYTVMYHPETQGGKSYPWAIPSKMGGGWSSEKRCQAISDRLENYRPDGLLELQTATENGYDILCATTVDVPRCRIVLTVPIGQSPETVKNNVFDTLIKADSGEPVQGVNTYMGNGSLDLGNLGNLGGILNPNKPSNGLNLQQFLTPSDRGSGTFFKNLNNNRNNTLTPSPQSKPNQLNPDRFR